MDPVNVEIYPFNYADSTLEAIMLLFMKWRLYRKWATHVYFSSDKWVVMSKENQFPLRIPVISALYQEELNNFNFFFLKNPNFEGGYMQRNHSLHPKVRPFGFWKVFPTSWMFEHKIFCKQKFNGLDLNPGNSNFLPGSGCEFSAIRRYFGCSWYFIDFIR